ncbi:MAG: lipopolysaccharide heptosyltransferase II [Dehalococcoidia bacterium]|nr:lipopolysaccharide heptosyltransferase II [Dehalococcoidia bacterium]
MATPTLAALRAEWPDATIVVATSNWARPAIENHPAIDSFIDCAPTPQGGAGPLLETWRLAQRVRRGDFDLAVVLDRSPVVSLIPFLAGIPSRSGIDSAGRGFSLTKRVPALPLRHEADLYLDVARAAGCHPDAAALTFFPTGEDRAWAADALPKGEWVAVHPAGGVNPGSALPGKRWPSHGFRALAERLLDRGYGVVLLGGPGDYPFTQEIAALLPAHVRTHVYDFAGRSTFGQTAALLERCRLLVGNDTGVMHLAVAVATPVVAVFGPSKPLVYGPYHSSQSLVVHHEDQCGHCLFRGGLVTDCRNQFACMGAASVDEVTAAAQALMR